MSRLTATLLALLAALLVVVPLWLSVQGAGAAGTSADERTVRSSGGRVFIGGGIRAGK